MSVDGDQPGVMSTGERLVYMANQIARNFAAEGEDRAAAMVADHIQLYWHPRMRARIASLAIEQPGALSPIAARAIARIGGS